MTPPESLLRSMLSKQGAGPVDRALADMGYVVTRNRLEMLRSILLANGETAVISHSDRHIGGSTYIADPERDATEGSAKLEAAVNALYRRTAKRLRCSVEAAQLLLNYSPAQIEKMAA